MICAAPITPTFHLGASMPINIIAVGRRNLQMPQPLEASPPKKRAAAQEKLRMPSSDETLLLPKRKAFKAANESDASNEYEVVMVVRRKRRFLEADAHRTKLGKQYSSSDTIMADLSTDEGDEIASFGTVADAERDMAAVSDETSTSSEADALATLPISSVAAKLFIGTRLSECPVEEPDSTPPEVTADAVRAYCIECGLDPAWCNSLGL